MTENGVQEGAAKHKGPEAAVKRLGDADEARRGAEPPHQLSMHVLRPRTPPSAAVVIFALRADTFVGV
jgi:hypothetical protein